MRSDSLGLFWRDEPPPPKVKKEKIKCVPPDPVWLHEDYLPGLEEALAFNIPLFTADEIVFENKSTELELEFDIESYANYFQIAFYSEAKNKYISFELIGENSSFKGDHDQLPLLTYIVTNCKLISFNGMSYDIPMLTLALNGVTVLKLKQASDLIIQQNTRAADICKMHKIKAEQLKKYNHIDIREVIRGSGGLKLYAGRLHSQRMQDLPFPPDAILSLNQIAIVRYYCINDLKSTNRVKSVLFEPLRLRALLSKQYNLELRSKSDAQIAEAVIAHEIQKKTGRRPTKPEIIPGKTFNYKNPGFLVYSTGMMNAVFSQVLSTKFEIGYDGKVGIPKELEAFDIKLGELSYNLQIGGLHSKEKVVSYSKTDTLRLVDADVESFYPRIILNQKLYPPHLGPIFLAVYEEQVVQRLAAKARKDKSETGTRKIIINGAYGKLGSPYSILYAPELMIQVTLTGQLVLLMLIERMELAGLTVVSANTDGVVCICPNERSAELAAIYRQWELDTNFKLEFNTYRELAIRDVNNYMAITEDGKTKGKGCFANFWKTLDLSEDQLSINPTATICTEAVERFIRDGTPMMTTITDSREIAKFLSIRTVKGGAVKLWEDGRSEYLGKVVRWYYGEDKGPFVYANSGKRVPKSIGAIPAMDLPAKFPENVDYDWYIAESEKLLKCLGR
jgi:hypothetical protein